MTISVVNTSERLVDFVTLKSNQVSKMSEKTQKIKDENMNAYKHSFALHLERTNQSELSPDSSSVNIIT